MDTTIDGVRNFIKDQLGAPYLGLLDQQDADVDTHTVQGGVQLAIQEVLDPRQMRSDFARRIAAGIVQGRAPIKLKRKQK